LRSPFYPCVCESHPINFWMSEPVFMTHIYHGNWAYLNGVIHKSLPSIPVSVSVSLLPSLRKGSVKCIPLFIARQRLGKHVPVSTTTLNNRRTVGSVCLCIPVSLLGHNSVKTFPRQLRIVGGVVFYAVRDVPMDSGRLVFPRTSCSFLERLLETHFANVHRV
jgi:hypothetical protein